MLFLILFAVTAFILRGKHIIAFFNAALAHLGEHRPPAIAMLLVLPTLLFTEVGAACG